MGRSIPWAEFGRLLERLAADPSTWLHAEVNDWSYPATWEFITLHRLHEHWLGSKVKKPQKHRLPAPWDPRPKKYGTAVSREEFDAFMAKRRALPAVPQEPITP